LEYEVDLAAKIPGLGQVLGCAEQYAGVTVVATGVHGAIVGGAMLEVVFFQNWQCMRIVFLKGLFSVSVEYRNSNAEW
jgi:hypothetical protein